MKEIFSVDSDERLAKKLSVIKKTVDELGRVYRCRTPGIEGKPPSFLTEVTYVYQHLITGFPRVHDSS